MMYYKGTTEGAELQLSGIVSLFEYFAEERSFESKHDLFLDNYADLLSELRNIDMHDSTRKAIARAFNKFVEVEREHKLLSTKSVLKEEEFIDNITRSGSIAVIDFSADGATGVDLPTKQLVMTYLATILVMINQIQHT